MICQSCNQNLATVHLTEIVQKAKKETHLCEECAKDKGITYSTHFSVKDFLGGLKKSKPSEPSPSEPSSVLPEPAASASEPSGTEAAPCPSCGISFGEFRQSGRLGCHLDYDHFRVGLAPLLEKIHDATQHTGRVPSKIGERIKRQREVSRFKKELQDAIGNEEYERAAELRDKIRELEQLSEKP